MAKSHCYHADTPEEIVRLISSHDRVSSIEVTLNQFVALKAKYELGFKHNKPTFKGVRIRIKAGNENNLIMIECG